MIRQPKSKFTAIKRIGLALGRSLKVLLFIPPVLLGVLAIYYAGQNAKSPERVPEQEQVRVLRVIKVPTLDVTPRAVGYGTAQPAKEWEAVAEVSGRIVQLHPHLEAGTFIEAGDLLVQIDTTDTQLAIDRLEAEVESSQATVNQLAAQQKNLTASLAIAKESLTITESELARDLRLVNEGAGSLDDVDSQKRSVNSERNAVQTIINELNLLPTQIKSAQAAIRVAKSNLAEQQRNLGRCKLSAPFKCRLGPVNLEVGEYVANGTSLLTAQSTDRIEVEAQFTARNLQRVIQPKKRRDAIDESGNSVSREMLKRIFDVQATVRYGASGVRASRPAEFQRIREELDSQARTAGIVVSIDQPYALDANASQRTPPPVSGTYCEVELQASVIPGAMVIPRSALIGDTVYVLDDDSRLQQRKVKVRFHQDQATVIESGLEPQETVIISDATPAIPGMLVEPNFDTEALTLLKEVVKGTSN